MQLISVNIGREQPIQHAKPGGKTGIYKQPVNRSVKITIDGLTDDTICDKKNHGGLDQAVYIYGVTDYNWWSTALGRELAPGTFGENLTISNLESANFCIGDRLHVGTVILEVTAPRLPCVTLAARMEDPLFVKRFRQAERPGLYCRVIQTGTVQEGNSVSVEAYQGKPITALALFRNFYEPALDEATLRRYLATPLAVRARTDLQKKLDQVLAQK